MKSRLLKKLIAHGSLLFMVVFFSVSPLLGVDVAHAQILGFWGEVGKGVGTVVAAFLFGMNIILTGILYFVGQLLDFAIQYSIAPNVDPETGLGSLYTSETINTAWTLLRDIINMSFIFILLYVAIGTVLNIQNVNWKKQVSQIIVAAILVNFSLFITRVVVDAGNIIANGFYQELTLCEEGECGGRERVGISERFAGALGLPYSNELRDGPVASGYEGWEGVGTALMQIAVTLIAMWVFVSVSILFLARTFALVFILVLSPIGIAGSSLPILGKYAKQWREELFKQSMIGVVFLFFTFVILLFATLERDDILARNTAALGDVNEELVPITGPEGAPRSESFFIMYALIVAALIMTLRLTKNLSGQIGKFADGVGKGIIGVGLGLGIGGAALAMRAGAGGVASRTLANEELKAKARAGDRVAQTRLDAANVFAKSSFDVRQSSLGKVATKKLKGIGLDVSTTQKAGKGGYEAGMEKYQKEQVERSKRYAPSEDYTKEKAIERNKPINDEYEKKIGYADRMEAQALSLPEGDNMRERKLKTVKELRTKAKEYKDKNQVDKNLVLAEEQERFASSLEKKSRWKKAVDRRRKRAAAAIRKEMKKGDFDKLLDAVKDSTKKEDKKEDNE